MLLAHRPRGCCGPTSSEPRGAADRCGTHS